MKGKLWRTNSQNALSLLLASILSLSAFAVIMPGASAQPITTVRVIPETTKLGPAGTFTVAVVVENVKNLYGLDIRFGWDTRYLKYVSHTVTIPVEDHPKPIPPSPYPGTLHSPILKIKDEVNEAGLPGLPGDPPGTLYWIAYASMAPAPSLNGSGTIFTITFDTKPQPWYEKLAFAALYFIGVDLADINGAPIPHQRIVLELPVIDVKVDVGSIYFRGEKAEFYFSVAPESGISIDATTINAALYFDGALFADLSPAVKHVATGLYMIPYTIPLDAKTGTYTLVVKASYFISEGTALKSFLISSTLTGWDASIKKIEGDIATIIIPGLNDIKMNLTDIGAKVVAIKETVAIIETHVGTIKADVATIKPVIAKIEGDVVAIKTTLGEVQLTVGAIQSTATMGLTVASILSAIAAIAAILAVVLLRKRAK